MSVAAVRSAGPLVRWGSLAAMIAGGLLIVKVAVVYATQGAESLLVGSLYVTGMLLPLFAAAGVAAYVGRDRGLAVRAGIYVLIVLGFIFFVTTFSEVVESAFLAISGAPEWVAIEIPVALTGAIWLWVGYRIWTSTEENQASSPQRA